MSVTPANTVPLYSGSSFGMRVGSMTVTFVTLVAGELCNRPTLHSYSLSHSKIVFVTFSAWGCTTTAQVTTAREMASSCRPLAALMARLLGPRAARESWPSSSRLF